MNRSTRWGAFVLAAFTIVASLAIASATAGKSKATASVQVCALLPDTKSSTRYTLFDRPFLLAAFKKAGISAQVLNAQNSAAKMRSQADQCLTQGAEVILLDAIDPGSGMAITNAIIAGGAKVIDYDRLVPKSKASYYVSFDNVGVGKLQGRGLAAALKNKPGAVIAKLNGGKTDNNAHLFKQGYDSILNPLIKSGKLKQAAGGDQWTDWDSVKGLRIFEQMLARNGNKIDGVLAANDGLAGAVVSALQSRGLKPVALTGQDATPTGIQYILAGWQTGTVYKSVRAEANAAAQVAINMINGTPVKTNGKVSGTPSVLLTPVWVTKANYKIVFKEGFLKKSQVCVGKYAQYC